MRRLLDTNHAIAHLNGDPRIAIPFAQARAAGDSFALSTTSLGEFYYGAYASARVADNLAQLKIFLAQIVLYAFDSPAADEFGKILAELRSKGRPIGTADGQIAAVARLHDLQLLTDDAHFQQVDGLNLENWLA